MKIYPLMIDIIDLALLQNNRVDPSAGDIQGILGLMMYLLVRAVVRLCLRPSEDAPMLVLAALTVEVVADKVPLTMIVAVYHHHPRVVGPTFRLIANTPLKPLTKPRVNRTILNPCPWSATVASVMGHPEEAVATATSHLSKIQAIPLPVR